MCSFYFHNLSINDKMNRLQIITTQVLVMCKLHRVRTFEEMSDLMHV